MLLILIDGKVVAWMDALSMLVTEVRCTLSYKISPRDWLHKKAKIDGETAQQAKVLAAKLIRRVPFLGLTWRRERTSFFKFSSDLHTPAVAHVQAPSTHTLKNKQIKCSF